jgi:putative glutamine amidotransferase
MPKQVLLPFRYFKKAKAYEAAAHVGGMEPLPVSVDDPMPLDRAAGLLLIGGTDVNPKCYGAAAESETNAPDDDRDRVELELIHAAIERDLPILAICRGLQILNVYHGGTLTQHLGSARHYPEKDDHSGAAHEIQFSSGSRLAKIAGAPRWQVNSRHHQAVARVGGGLNVSARDSEDGVIEGLERGDKRFVVAVQWHPEDQIARYPEQLRLFQSFAAAL